MSPRKLSEGFSKNFPLGVICPQNLQIEGCQTTLTLLQFTERTAEICSLHAEVWRSWNLYICRVHLWSAFLDDNMVSDGSSNFPSFCILTEKRLTMGMPKSRLSLVVVVAPYWQIGVGNSKCVLALIDFQPTRFISETIQNRAIATVADYQ